MILLDTDHITVLRYIDHPRCVALTARLRASDDQEICISVITLEEQMRGWLAGISSKPDPLDQVPAYERLKKAHEFLGEWEILPFDVRAAEVFKRLRKERIRIGSQDLKIASIALIHDALLLSANLRDFHKVPDLRVENWMEE